MEKKELLDLICELLEIKEVNRMIESQIHRFVTKHGYNYKDIGRALFYFVRVKGQKPEVDKGIGIVPFVKNESTAYFENLKRQKQAEEQKALEMKKEIEKEKKVFKINPKKRELKNHKINMEDL